jgi:sulfite reductase (ferredoxin)
VVLGGQRQNNAGAYGLALISIPSKRIPTWWIEFRNDCARAAAHGKFPSFIKRIGKRELARMLEDLTHVPSFEADPSFYSDWGDPRV